MDSRPTLPLSALSVLAREQGNGSLLKRVLALDRLDAKVRRLLPDALREHIRVCNIRGETLVIGVRSAVWRSRLRLHEQSLARGLALEGVTIQRVASKLIAFPEEGPIEVPHPAPTLAGRAALASIAAMLGPDVNPLPALVDPAFHPKRGWQDAFAAAARAREASDAASEADFDEYSG